MMARPLVVVRQSRNVGGVEAARCLAAFVRAETSSERDREGQLDMTKTNRERISVVGSDVIAKLEAIKEAVLEEVAYRKASGSGNQATTTAQATAGKTPSVSHKRERSTDDKKSSSKKEKRARHSEG